MEPSFANPHNYYLYNVHYRSAEGSADKPGSTVKEAKTTVKKASDSDDYIASLKKRFPDATGEELVKKKYISSSYMDKFPAKKELFLLFSSILIGAAGPC